MLRQIPGIPLIYMNKSVFLLEPPSPATLQRVQEMEIQKNQPLNFEVSIKNKSEKRKLTEDGEEVKNDEEITKRKKRAKGPNPLSVKKKKV